MAFVTAAADGPEADRTDPSPIVGIVGLGLIGGSLAQALVRAGHEVVATTRRPEVQAAARSLGVTVVDDVASVVASSDVVVVAAALDALPALVAECCSLSVASERRPTVTDVGSVKVPVVEAVDPDHRSVFVGGHPMAGTEYAGWDAADPDLFHGRTWALAVEPDTDVDRWADVARVALASGAEVVPVEADAHDAAVARVSHLPYVLAALAARSATDGDHTGLVRSLAAGSFASLTRVAAGHPTLGAEMAWANRRALAAAAAEWRDALDHTIGVLGADDRRPIETLFAAGQQGRAALDTAGASRGAESVVRLDRGGLIALGRAGGAVVGVAVRGDNDGVEVTVRAPRSES